MSLKTAALAAVAVSAFALFGCAGTPNLDENWGRSYETARYTQTLNPDADHNLAPVEGIEGRAAERILEGHVKGRSEKKQSSPGYGVLTLQK